MSTLRAEFLILVRRTFSIHMKSLLTFIGLIVFSQVVIADALQKAIGLDEVAAIKFELPQAEPAYSEYKAILDHYYSELFTDLEIATLSKYELNLKLDKVHKVDRFVDVQNNIYLREVRRLNRRKQRESIVSAFQSQSSFDIPDSTWIPSCIRLKQKAGDKGTCTKADAVSGNSIVGRATYNTYYWGALVVELSATFRISPTTVDMAKEYLNEDVSLNASVNDAIDKVEHFVDVDKDAAYKYLFSATEDLVIAHIKNLKSTRVISVTPRELRDGGF